MSTFSQLVDEAVRETQRPDLRDTIATYVNQTIRELHFRPDLNAPLTYTENFRELQLVANQDTGQTWELPNPVLFQRIAGIQFPDVFVQGGTNWAKEKVPSPGLAPDSLFFYRVGSTIVMSNYGARGSRINIAWYEYPPRLKYQLPAQRLAAYDELDGWTYSPTLVTEEQRELARRVSANWLILRWHDVVLEGVRAKVYKRVSDESRQRTSYSLYQQLRQGLWISETSEFGV